LLVVGEVVRLADPLVLAEGFGGPFFSAVNETAFPAVLVADSIGGADFRTNTNEDPLA
jgi:hypothetical protein